MNGENEKNSRIKCKKAGGALLFLALSLVLAGYSLSSHISGIYKQWALSPYLFPLLASLCLFGLSLSMLFEKAQSKKKTALFLSKRFVYVSLCSVLYALCLPLFGFVFASTLYLFFMMRSLGEKRWLFAIAFSLLCSFVLYIVFAKLFYISLPVSELDVLQKLADRLI